MKTNNNSQHSTTEKRRTLFTNDARLAIRRKPAAKMSADGAADVSAEQTTGEIVTLEGYAIVWNELSDDRGGFVVRLLPGSARFTDEAHGLFHHDFKSILGATGNSTLKLTSDDIGVKVEIDLPNTQTARDVTELVEKKYVKGMSFSLLYNPPPEFTIATENGVEVQTFSMFWCDEVTVTAIPAFTTTTIGVQQAPDDDTEDDAQQAVEAYARVEQEIRLDQPRLKNMAL